LAEYQKAPEVTRERLYLDAMQQVMANTNKVLVDVEGGNNVMYLPLDKMAPAPGSRRSAIGSSSSGLSESDLRQLTERVTEELRRAANNSNTNRRGGR